MLSHLVVGGATDGVGLAGLAAQVLGEAEVHDAHVPPLVQEHVLRLQILRLSGAGIAPPAFSQSDSDDQSCGPRPLPTPPTPTSPH